MRTSQTLTVGLALAFAMSAGFGQSNAGKSAATKSAPSRPTAAVRDQGPQKWIGVRVMPLMPTTRSHLKKYLNGMPEDAGLTVTDVSAEGPAVVAGIERYDILLRADGQVLTKAEQLQEILNKRNFGTSVRLDIIHEGQPKTVYALVLEKPEGEPGLAGGFRGFGGRGGPGGPGGFGGGPGGPGRGPFGNATSTLTYTDADGKRHSVTGDEMREFFRKMREDEKFREAVSKEGFTIRIKPGPREPRPEGGDQPPPNP
ncbi:MAG: PDZ domain-containing protein [Verrucomicrobiae bacterium]|nr:PDZ domain-containing protein [Verrucomicrobiae bacterium]